MVLGVGPVTQDPAATDEAAATGGGLAARTDDVGDVARRLADLQGRLDDLRGRLADRLEVSNRSVADDTAATGAAAEAGRAAVGARDAAGRTATAGEAARQRVDDWIAAQYQQADATGISAVLQGAQGPADVLDRAALHDAVSTEQQADLAALAAARTRADADAATAAAAQQTAEETARRAGAARVAAQAELGRVRGQLARSERDLGALTAQRDTAAARLDVLAADDPAVAAQRRAERSAADGTGTAVTAADAAARDAAIARLSARGAPGGPTTGDAGTTLAPGADGTTTASARAAAPATTTRTTSPSPSTGAGATPSSTPSTTPPPSTPSTSPGGAGRTTTPSTTTPTTTTTTTTTTGRPPSTTTPPATGDAGRVEIVVDRALSQLGVTYAWGGGNAAGPTRGIRDGGVADSFGDFDRTGFDCSGLMIYAFAGIGTMLPHYSGYQAAAGRTVPLADRKPGDMLFWADPADGVHHVALYLGRNRMVEAPESGKVVRISPVRLGDGIVGQVTRMIG